jgi:hypothetical protein
MKATTLQSRIESKLTAKTGNVQVKFEKALSFITYPERIHPYSWSGSVRRMKLVGNDNVREALDLLGIDYSIGNDAPRGGQQGYYVELTKKGLQQTKEWRMARLVEAKLRAEAVARFEADQKALYEARLVEIREKIEADSRISDYVNRKRSEGENDRTIAWKLTSSTRNPNLSAYSVREIMDAVL